MGKYAGILDDLKPAPLDPEAQARQEKIDAEKLKLTVNIDSGEVIEYTPAQLAEQYAVARLELEVLDAKAYVLSLRKDALQQLLVESWEKDQEGWGLYGAGPNTVVLPNGMAIDVDAQPVGKIEDPQAFLRWCKTSADHCGVCGCTPNDVDHEGSEQHVPSEHAHEFVPGGNLEHKLTIASSTMQSMAKQRALAGDAPMPGTAVYALHKVKLRKAKAVKE